MKKWFCGIFAAVLTLLLAVPAYAALPDGVGMITNCSHISGKEFSSKSSIAKKLDIDSAPGLADLLKGKGAQISEFQTYLLPNWCILPSGDIPPNPAELWGSARMEKLLNQLRSIFDYIIIDLPPVNLVSDAVSISSLISGMIVVIREEYTEKKELERCFRQLKLSNVNILGCVLNEAKSGNGSYGKYKKYRYYKYYKYYQYYQSESKETKK